MKLYAGARAYWIEGAEVPGESPQFPSPRAGPTPPLGTCCRSGGTCQPVDNWWQDQIWSGLQFELDRPHRYSYEYRGAGTGFTVLAHGDLDCDGIYSKLWIDGSIPASGEHYEAGAVVQSERELE